MAQETYVTILIPRVLFSHLRTHALFLVETEDDWGKGGREGRGQRGWRVSKINLTEAACGAAVLLKRLLNLLQAVPTLPDTKPAVSIYANATVHAARQ